MFPSCHAYTFIAMTQLFSQYFEVYELSALVFAHQDKQITSGLLDNGDNYPFLHIRQSIAEVNGSVTGIPCATHGSKSALSRRRIVEEGFDAHFDTM